jgi:hypothetical protein
MLIESRLKMAPLKLPYGISDFNDIRTENFFYVDKTRYIEELERLNAKYLFFIRPRRFGKSLFLSILEHYYDLNKKDDFDSLFGDLYIGKHPTERRNQYFILYLDFSGLDTSDSIELKRSFKEVFQDAIIQFFNKYTTYFEDVSILRDRVEQRNSLRSIWDILFGAVKKSGHKIYLIIDEYDDFVNDIIAMDDSLFYKEITHASGFVRSFYKAVKIGTKSVIDRIFITGISPIMLDDLTSGFNIAENMTMNPICGEMLGFTEEEVWGIVNQFESNMDPEMLMDELRSNYNGYLFHEEGQWKVYNPDMILYFFNQWSMFGRYPKNLVDNNVKIDYTRLRRLISNEQNRSMLVEIIANERVTARIISRFSFDNMYDEKNFVSLLFYIGLLTIQRTSGYRQVELVIPNYVVKTVLWEYLGSVLEKTAGMKYDIVDELGEAVQEMALRGNIYPFVDFIGEMIQGMSYRDKLSEQLIKGILLCYLDLTDIYRIASEREVVGRGYTDILLQKRSINDVYGPEVKVEWVLELKYIKKEDRNQLESIRREAVHQLRRYTTGKDLAEKPCLKAAVLLFIGKDEIVVEEVL